MLRRCAQTLDQGRLLLSMQFCEQRVPGLGLKRAVRFHIRRALLRDCTNKGPTIPTPQYRTQI